eukprot:1585170-Rhodomonas_salina.1
MDRADLGSSTGSHRPATPPRADLGLDSAPLPSQAEQVRSQTCVAGHGVEELLFLVLGVDLVLKVVDHRVFHACATAALDVALGRVELVEADHEAAVWDVQALLYGVRSHKQVQLLCRELVQHVPAPRIRHVAHPGNCADSQSELLALLLERVHEAVSRAENDTLAVGFRRADRLQKLQQRFDLLRLLTNYRRRPCLCHALKLV